ncbi:MAG: IMPACT family protein [Acidimicrobiia bacterium]|nr:IMPACT family protein [Acidimicrobiia bacterium]
MFSVAARVRHQIDPIKGSRFVATVAPVDSEAAAHQLVEEVRAEFPDASHHCTAWRIARPAIDRCNDDGEPGGSAGRPILAQLTGRDLVDVAVVVTRYFGGTKLGVGGLVRAYGSAAGAALDRAELIAHTPTTTFQTRLGYDDADRVQRALNELGATIVDTVYTAQVTITVSVPEDQLDEARATVADASAGRAEVSPDPDSP